MILSWIISSLEITSLECERTTTQWYYYSDEKCQINSNLALIEGNYYYYDHFFCNSKICDFDCIEGSYAIAIIKDSNIICATDCANTRNIFYYESLELKMISSSLKLLVCSLLQLKKKIFIDERYVATYIKYGNAHYMTPYKNIYKLLPGYLIDANKTIKQIPYWHIDTELKNAFDFVIAYENIETVCIKILSEHCRKILETNKSITLEVSGGIDSSLLAGLTFYNNSYHNRPLTAYSYVYNQQTIGNELFYMNQVVKKNHISNHVVTKLDCEFSTELTEMFYYPETYIMNINLLNSTRDIYAEADAIISGQGGDNCIGDYYDPMIDNDHLLQNIICDSYYSEKNIYHNVLSKFIAPLIFNNISLQKKDELPSTPLWMTRRLNMIANHALNITYSKCKFVSNNIGLQKTLLDCLQYSGMQTDDLVRCHCYYPYLSRDMIVLGRVYNSKYYKGSNIYRERIKKAARKYIPLPVYLRKGKSRMDEFSVNLLRKHGAILSETIGGTNLLNELNIDRSLVKQDLQNIVMGLNNSLEYMLRILSAIIWYDRICNTYPNITMIK